MKRRALLAAAGTGLAELAGCTGGPLRDTPTATPSPDVPLVRHGTPPDVCESDVIDVGIDAIDAPAFAADWSAADVADRYARTDGLADDRTVVGLAGDGQARAYPVPVLYHHEIVNDTFSPLGDVVVTYCSLCRSGMVASRVVAGAPATFGVSGQLWTPPAVNTRAAEADGRTFAVERGDTDPGPVRNTGNLVMVDHATGSYWSQLLARGICGPEQGTELPMVAATTATWGDWRLEHPDGAVLLPPPASGTVAPP